MKIIKEAKEEKIIINKSIFIANIFYVEDKNSYLEALAKTKAKYSDASHNCFAVKISSVNIIRFSDDKEPSGTAGKIILKAIEDYELDNIIIIVTRYFGGKQLGFGGLVHAYKNISLIAIKNNNITTIELFTVIKFEILNYSIVNKILHYIEKNRLKIISKNFSANPLFEVAALTPNQLEFLSSFNQNELIILQKREMFASINS